MCMGLNKSKLKLLSQTNDLHLLDGFDCVAAIHPEL
jgi:hypothetical protein